MFKFAKRSFSIILSCCGVGVGAQPDLRARLLVFLAMENVLARLLFDQGVEARLQHGPLRDVGLEAIGLQLLVQFARCAYGLSRWPRGGRRCAAPTWPAVACQAGSPTNSCSPWASCSTTTAA